MDKSHTVILMFSTVPVENNRYNFLNPELNKILGKCYFLCISISSKLNQDIWITGYVCVEALRKLLSARLEPVLWEPVHM